MQLSFRILMFRRKLGTTQQWTNNVLLIALILSTCSIASIVAYSFTRILLRIDAVLHGHISLSIVQVMVRSLSVHYLTLYSLIRTGHQLHIYLLDGFVLDDSLLSAMCRLVICFVLRHLLILAESCLFGHLVLVAEHLIDLLVLLLVRIKVVNVKRQVTNHARHRF